MDSIERNKTQNDEVAWWQLVVGFNHQTMVEK